MNEAGVKESSGRILSNTYTTVVIEAKQSTARHPLLHLLDSDTPPWHTVVERPKIVRRTIERQLDLVAKVRGIGGAELCDVVLAPVCDDAERGRGDRVAVDILGDQLAVADRLSRVSTWTGDAVAELTKDVV